MAQAHVSNHPIILAKLTQLRDTKTNHIVFRQLVYELTLMLGYEATQNMKFTETSVSTPMGEAGGHQITDTVGIIPILRAGLGMVDGIIELIPTAQVWHIGFYRDEETLKPVPYYNKLPDEPTVDICLVVDPMLATGGSAIATIDILKKWGVKQIKFVGLIAAPEGIEKLASAHPDVDIHVAAVDSHLNEIGFIVPGLGDAGDRQFGTT